MGRGGRAVRRGRPGAGCRRAGGQSQAQPSAQPGPRSDGQIEMDVVHALDASAALKNDLITAATIQGEVTLSGTVSTDASKQLAESIAAHVDGVTKVHNNLQIGNPGPTRRLSSPPPAAQDVPDADQSQTQQGTAGMPASGTGSGARIRTRSEREPGSGNPPNPQQGAYPPPPAAAAAVPEPAVFAVSAAVCARAGAPAYTPASGPVTLAPGTLLQLRTSEPVDSKRAKDGQPVEFMVIQDVTMGGVLAIPRGAVVHGVIAESKNVGSGQLAGSSTLALTLTSLDLGGRNYPLQTDQFKVKAPNKAGQTVNSALTGGVIGTIIGCAVGRGAGCAIGAGAGVAAGTAAGTASPGPRAWIPAEALVSFHLAAPLTVDPVSPQEAARLAQGLYPGGPKLYRRGYPMDRPITDGTAYLRVSAGLLSPVFHGGRGVLLAVEDRDQGSGIRGAGILHTRMPDVR